MGPQTEMVVILPSDRGPLQHPELHKTVRTQLRDFNFICLQNPILTRIRLHKSLCTQLRDFNVISVEFSILVLI